MRRSRLFVLALTATAVAVAAPFATSADVPSTVQVVTACIHNGNAQLRLVSGGDGCGSSEGALTWNATVATTLPAPQIGDVFTNRSSGGREVTPVGDIDVLTLSLPAGSYSISGRVTLSQAARAEVTNGFCGIDAGLTRLDQASAGVDAPADALPMPLQAVATFTAPTVLTLRCHNLGVAGAGPVFFLDPVLTAVVVGKVATQP